VIMAPTPERPAPSTPAWRVAAGRDYGVVSREFGALRAVGLHHRGVLDGRSLRAMVERVEAAVRDARVPVGGPPFAVLRSDPWETAPNRRRTFVGVPVVGTVAAPEGLTVERFSGGLFLLVIHGGPVATLEEAYGFLFGRFLRARGYELARAEAPEIRLLYPTSPLEVPERDLVTEVAVPVVITMRTDTMRNQR